MTTTASTFPRRPRLRRPSPSPSTDRHFFRMAGLTAWDYNEGLLEAFMKPKRPKPAVLPKPHDGATRPPDAPLNEGVAESFQEVEPAGFTDHPRSSIDAALVDPDVDDSEGGK